MSEQQKGPFCPYLYSGNASIPDDVSAYRCDKEACALYHADRQACAHLVSARALESIAASLMALTLRQQVSYPTVPDIIVGGQQP